METMEGHEIACIVCSDPLQRGDKVRFVEQCLHLVHERCSRDVTGTCPVDGQVFDARALCETSALTFRDNMESRFRRLMINQSDTHCRRNIAWIFCNERSDEEKAVKWLMDAAEAIDPSPNAMIDLAERYSSGKGVLQDEQKANRYREGATPLIEELQRRNAGFLAKERSGNSKAQGSGPLLADTTSQEVRMSSKMMDALSDAAETRNLISANDHADTHPSPSLQSLVNILYHDETQRESEDTSTALENITSHDAAYSETTVRRLAETHAPVKMSSKMARLLAPQEIPVPEVTKPNVENEPPALANRISHEAARTEAREHRLAETDASVKMSSKMARLLSPQEIPVLEATKPNVENKPSALANSHSHGAARTEGREHRLAETDASVKMSPKMARLLSPQDIPVPEELKPNIARSGSSLFTKLFSCCAKQSTRG